MLESFTVSTFTAHLQSEFQLAIGPDQTVALALIEAEELGSTPAQERFSLIFRGPLDRFLDQGLYPMTHAALGQFDLFLVPIQQDSTGYLYQAAFNRLLHP